MPRRPKEFVVARHVRFFPLEDGRGKYHAADKLSMVPLCGQTTALLNIGRDNWVSAAAGQVSTAVTPFACRSCLYLAGAQGYTPRAR